MVEILWLTTLELPRDLLGTSSTTRPDALKHSIWPSERKDSKRIPLKLQPSL
jgi:hypothetical protein